MIGKKISEILIEIEDDLWAFESEKTGQPNYTNDGFRAAIKIFMSAILDKMWNLQNNENILMEDKMKMATKCGEDLRTFIKTYTDIDTYELYK